jgi:hypothetical protein
MLTNDVGKLTLYKSELKPNTSINITDLDYKRFEPGSIGCTTVA